jgi:alcohol dehydrogenase (cytochrome c)
MSRCSNGFALLGFVVLAGAALAQPSGGSSKLAAVAAAPVTDAMLRNPDPADWLMYSRTYDAQRFSPLDDIDRGNVGSLAPAWSKPLGAGQLEIIPLVYRGVMYLTTPRNREGGSRVVAIVATTGETLWEYVTPNMASSRVKALAIYGDLIYYNAPAPNGEPNPLIALDAATGAVRWQTPVSAETHTAGAIVVEGKVISGRACNLARSSCYLAAHDALTGT